MNGSPAQPRLRPLIAFLCAAPIGVVGGLLGLGGAEYRLPVLVGPLRYRAHQAIALNLAISLALDGAKVGLLDADITRLPCVTSPSVRLAPGGWYTGPADTEAVRKAPARMAKPLAIFDLRYIRVLAGERQPVRVDR